MTPIALSAVDTDLPICETDDAAVQDEWLSPVAAAALQFAQSLDLPVVLDQVARLTAELLNSSCQVHFALPERPSAARYAVAEPPAHDAERAGAESAQLDHIHASEPRRRSGYRGDDTRASAASLLVEPLVARGRHIGSISVAVAARDADATVRSQRLLRALAAPAALALDTADEMGKLRAQSGREAGGGAATEESLKLALLAHDLRVPLSTLSTSVQMLARELSRRPLVDQDLALHLVEFAEAAVTQLEEQLSDLAPSQAKPAPRDAAPAYAVDLVTCARLMASFYQEVTSQHLLAVRADVQHLPGPWSRPHLERVLSNLLTNGIKYSPEGGEIRITVGREEGAAGAWATLCVENAGIGIPADDLAHLTRPGYRAQNVGSIRGTGLGLSSVRTIVEHYGGTIAIQSVLGGATAVLIRLPLT